VSPAPPGSAQPDEVSFGRPAAADPAPPHTGKSEWDPRSAPPTAAPPPPGPAAPAAVPRPATIRTQDRLPPADPADPAAHRGQPDPRPSPAAIATAGLTKRFRGGQVAVDNLTLEVPAGSVYGFLGPNGSGKTTTIRMLLGLVQPTSGSHRLLGVTMPAGLNAVLPRVGALVEGPAFYSFLSGRENLARIDAADRTASPRTAAARIAEALRRVGLTAAAGKHYRVYSLGMKQRLAIAAGLLRPRDLMILDEPTNGLDPQGTREVRALIREIAAEGTTVFVSSHLLAEVEQVSTHVGVMRSGRLVFQGTLDRLRATGAARITVLTPDAGIAVSVLSGLGLADVQPGDGEVSAQLGDAAPEDINARLVHAGVRVAGLATARPSLEDLFVELTGEGFDVDG
jgi:ABC-2 type transport system ATP-binding protein